MGEAINGGLHLNPLTDHSFGNVAGNTLRITASTLANAATRSLLDDTNFEAAIQAAIPDAIGQAIGEVVGAYLTSPNTVGKGKATAQSRGMQKQAAQTEAKQQQASEGEAGLQKSIDQARSNIKAIHDQLAALTAEERTKAQEALTGAPTVTAAETVDPGPYLKPLGTAPESDFGNGTWTARILQGEYAIEGANGADFVNQFIRDAWSKYDHASLITQIVDGSGTKIRLAMTSDVFRATGESEAIAIADLMDRAGNDYYAPGERVINEWIVFGRETTLNSLPVIGTGRKIMEYAPRVSVRPAVREATKPQPRPPIVAPSERPRRPIPMPLPPPDSRRRRDDPTCHPFGGWEPDLGWRDDDNHRYQAQVTHAPGLDYVVRTPDGDVRKFDGCAWWSPEKQLLEAKGPGYVGLLERARASNFYDSVFEGDVLQAKGQNSIAGGRPIEWHIASSETMQHFRSAVNEGVRRSGMPSSISLQNTPYQKRW